MTTFPKPRRNEDGKPCGECHLQSGETCDICGARRAPEPGKVYVEVSGLTGTGKSAVMGEIEIALRAIGLPVEYEREFDAEKRMTGADWQSELEFYKPTVVLVERNVPRVAKATAA